MQVPKKSINFASQMRRKAPLTKQKGSMSEWLGTGLQNRSQRFESAWNLEKPLRAIVRALCLLRLLPATAEIFTNLAGKSGNTHN